MVRQLWCINHGVSHSVWVVVCESWCVSTGVWIKEPGLCTSSALTHSSVLTHTQSSLSASTHLRAPRCGQSLPLLARVESALWLGLIKPLYPFFGSLCCASSIPKFVFFGDRFVCAKVWPSHRQWLLEWLCVVLVYSGCFTARQILVLSCYFRSLSNSYSAWTLLALLPPRFHSLFILDSSIHSSLFFPWFTIASIECLHAACPAYPAFEASKTEYAHSNVHTRLREASYDNLKYLKYQHILPHAHCISTWRYTCFTQPCPTSLGTIPSDKPI